MVSEIKISKMSGKLLNIPAINTNPLSNMFCTLKRLNKDHICNYCYAKHFLSFRTQRIESAFQHNSEILSESILTPSELPKIPNNRFVRLNAFGELINRNHFLNYLGICLKNPETIFSLITKKHDIVIKVLESFPKPDNIILIHGNPIIDEIAIWIPPYFDKVYTILRDKKGIRYTCIKKCTDCLKCYRKIGNRQIFCKLRYGGKKP